MPCWIPHSLLILVWFRAEISGPFQALPRTFIASTIRRRPDGKMLHGHDSWSRHVGRRCPAKARAQTEGPPKRVTVEKIENSEFCTSAVAHSQPLHRTNGMGKGVQFRTEPGDGRGHERFLRGFKNHGKVVAQEQMA